MQTNKECYICGATSGLELHHIYHGSNRKKSDEWGCVVWLCHRHHTTDEGVHFRTALDRQLKADCQYIWESRYGTREDFRKEFGKSWL